MIAWVIVLTRLPASAPCKRQVRFQVDTFECNVSDDDFVVGLWVVFIWYPFEDGSNPVLALHC